MTPDSDPVPAPGPHAGGGALARRFERLAADALPVRTVERDDGWRLRADSGPSRRGNSVLAERAGRDPLTAKLARVERFYRRRGLPPRFQLSPASEPAGLDAALDARGYRREPGARVLLAPRGHLAVLAAPAPPWEGGDPGPPTAEPDDDYLRVLAAVMPAAAAGAPARAAALSAAGLACAHLVVAASPGVPVAAALGVRDGDALGVFSMVTLPAWRGRGFAGRVLGELARWALAGGAGVAYLQVDERNERAQAVYERYGFRDGYRYYYRTAGEAPATRAHGAADAHGEGPAR